MNLIEWIVLVWLLLAIGVGLDAEDRDKGGFQWFSIVLVTGILGLTYYISKLPSEKETELEERITQLEAQQEYCPKCGNRLSDNACPSCNYKIEFPDQEQGGEYSGDQGSGRRSWVSPEDIDAEGTWFAKTIGYIIVSIVSLFIGVIFWHAIASKLVPFEGLPPNETILNLHRHIKDIGLALTFSLTLFGILLFRTVSNYHIVTKFEEQCISFTQFLTVLYVLWKITLVSTLFRTSLQIITAGGTLLITALITVWTIRNSGFWTPMEHVLDYHK